METWWDMGSWFCLCEMGVSNHRGVVLQWADSLKSKISFCRGVCHGWRTDLVSNVLIFVASCNIHYFLWSYPHLFGCTVRTQAVKNQLLFCCSTAAVALMHILLATLNHKNNSPSSCMMLRLATTDGPKFELGWPWLWDFLTGPSFSTPLGTSPVQLVQFPILKSAIPMNHENCPIPSHSNLGK